MISIRAHSIQSLRLRSAASTTSDKSDRIKRGAVRLEYIYVVG